MDRDNRHNASWVADLFMRFMVGLAALVFAVFMVWMMMSTTNTKLFEADNVVCASRPLAIQCWHR